jgi:hypothetical protein
VNLAGLEAELFSEGRDRVLVGQMPADDLGFFVQVRSDDGWNSWVESPVREIPSRPGTNSIFNWGRIHQTRWSIRNNLQRELPSRVRPQN